MHFADAVAIIVTSPFLDRMADGGMRSLELVITVIFIGVDLSGGLGELMRMSTQDGSRGSADDAQSHLSALSSNRPDDRGTVVGVGSPPTPFVRPASWRIRWVAVFIAFFPPHSETSHRFWSLDRVRALLVAAPERWLARLCGSYARSHALHQALWLGWRSAHLYTPRAPAAPLASGSAVGAQTRCRFTGCRSDRTADSDRPPDHFCVSCETSAPPLRGFHSVDTSSRLGESASAAIANSALRLATR